MPKITAARMDRLITVSAEAPTGSHFIISAPPSAPNTMMPSRPMLITPECSEKQPPSATSINTEAKMSMY